MSFNVLSRNTDVFGHFFLEASAGTGKTFAIEHITVRLIIESYPSISIDKILIVTFTRAATRDLKVRIRAALVQALDALAGRSSAADYLQPILDKGESAIFSAVLKLESALYDFDKASIYTLHAFCHRMLHLHQFDTGITIDHKEVDPSLFHEKMYQFVEDLLLTGVDPYLLSPCQLFLLLKEHGGAASLIKKIVKKMEKGVFVQSSSSFSDTLQALKGLGQRIKRQVQEGWLEDCDRFFLCFKKIKPYHLKQAVDVLQSLVTGSIDANALDALVKEKDSFIFLASEDNAKKNKQEICKGLRHAHFLKECTSALRDILTPARDPKVLTLTLLAECIRRWQASPLYSQNIAADDLLLLMKKAIEDDLVAEMIASQYSSLIIDEFQDTDPLQWEIFKRLFFKPGVAKTVYLVGDPKQSIYAFRSADVYTYLEAMELMGAKSRLRLDTNYRSSKELVAALNALFSEVTAPTWMPLPRTSCALQVYPVKAGITVGGSYSDKGRGAVHFFMIEAEKGRSERWPTEDAERQQLFPFIASEILSLHRDEGRDLSSFAVLVRDRFSGERLQRYFREKDIPSTFQQGMHLEKSLAYQSLVDLVDAVQNPSELGAIKRVLAGGMVSLAGKELHDSFENPLMQRVRAYFTSAASFIKEKGWMAFVEDFLRLRIFSDRMLLEEILCRPDPSLYVELRNLLQLCYSRGADMFGIQHFSATLQSLSCEDREEGFFSPGVSDGRGVHIMTIHASKGLEFDVIFALGVGYRYQGVSDDIKVMAEGRRFVRVRDEMDPLCYQSILEAEAEKMRQLYVALTRARHRLYIPVIIDKDQRQPAISAASAIELFIQGFGANTFDIAAAYSSIPLQTAEKLIAHLQSLAERYSITFSKVDSDMQVENVDRSSYDLAALKHEGYTPSIAKKMLTSFSSLYSSNKERDGQGALFLPASPLPLPAGAETGTIVHEVMEKAIREGWHQEPLSSSLSSYVAEHLANTALAGLDDHVIALVEKSFSLPLSCSRHTFTLQEVPSANFFLEMEFAFAWDLGIMKGFIDAVCVYKGKYYLFDWKTNVLEDSTQSCSKELLHSAMEKNGYYFQASIYREALRRYLAKVEKRSFASCFGGAFYLFMRGEAYLYFMPEDLSEQKNSLLYTK